MREGHTTYWPVTELGVGARVGNRWPERDTLTTFEVAVGNFSYKTYAFSLYTDGQWEVQVQVKVELSPGLSLSSTLQAPAGPLTATPVSGRWGMSPMQIGILSCRCRSTSPRRTFPWRSAA